MTGIQIAFIKAQAKRAAKKSNESARDLKYLKLNCAPIY